MKVVVKAHTSLDPEKVKAMLIDFSDQRPQIWPGLAAEQYKVYSVGETTADIREGNKKPNIWARERYDWSKPGIVRWEVVESNFSKPGSYVETKIDPASGGGSDLTVTWERWPTSLLGRVAMTMIVATRGAPVKASLMAGLKRAGG
jgi:hypothetical protein